MIRLISTDFDGTIFDSNTTPNISRELIDRIREVQLSGGKWIINTGRDFSSTIDGVAEAGIDILPDFIVSVERHIHQQERGQYSEHFHWNVTCQLDHKKLFRAARGRLRSIRTWVRKRFSVELYEDSWSPLCIVATTITDADHIHQQIEEVCSQVEGLTVVRNGVYFRFGHQRYTKGTALSEIARLLEVPRERIFAAGDHYNDLPMLNGAHAALVAAPSNAIPEVKTVVLNAGGFVAQRTCSSGIFDALTYFGKSNGTLKMP